MDGRRHSSNAGHSSRRPYGERTMDKQPPPPRHGGCSPKQYLAGFIDVIAVAAVFAADRLIAKYVDSSRRGFFCNDDSLKYPYREDTVTVPVLFSLIYIIPLVLILVIEGIRYAQDRAGRERRASCQLFISVCFRYFFAAAFVNVATLLLTDVAKLSVGRLRPHFFDACKLDWSTVNCSAGYVTQYTCTQTDDDILKDMRLSFFSGHASSAMAPAIFLVFYLQVRWRWLWLAMVRGVIQLALVAAATYVGYSRIHDNKHHALDVLAGMVCGALVAWYGAMYLAFLRETTPEYTSGEPRRRSMHSPYRVS